jgi:hypothetical protein
MDWLLLQRTLFGAKNAEKGLFDELLPLLRHVSVQVTLKSSE